MTVGSDVWAPLPFADWKPTCDTLHLWTQVAGKLRLALSPKEPEHAGVGLYVTARGITTGPMPAGDRLLQADFDLIAHEFVLYASDGQRISIELRPRTVASFYEEVIAALQTLDVTAKITTMPQEVPDPIPFERDTVHAAYEPAWANRFWRVLTLVDAAFIEHRAPFRRRHTPVHLFWGSFDLAYTRYSGVKAEPPPNAPWLLRTSMDAQEISVGFWPGYDKYPDPAFYCYGYPKPAGIEDLSLRPRAAAWNADLGEFILPYEDVRTSASPHATILEFLSSSYDAIAKLAAWE